MEIDAVQSGLTVRRSWRAAIGVFLVAPFAVLLLAAGVLFLWENPWLLPSLWIPIPVCWLLGWGLYRLGKRCFGPVWQPGAETPLRWTALDHDAWRLVVAYADERGEVAPDAFYSTNLYRDSVTELSSRLAAHYHGQSRQSLDALTIPEILTAVELAVSDLRAFLEEYVPGSHLMTIGWLKKAPQVSTAWRRLRPVYYAASALWRPWSFLPRLAISGVVVNPVIEELKQESLTGLYRAFVLQAGKYLIELHSRRLQVGPARWRALMEASRTTATPCAPSPAVTDRADDQGRDALRIIVAGQVKAGKSSLINALIGHQRAAVDVLPLTASIEQYRARLPGAHRELILLDTVGYAHAGEAADQLRHTMTAARQASLIVLVLNACDPARDPDERFLRELETWYAARPQLPRPAVLVVVTHIDGLPPPLEWNPPYDNWLKPDARGPKEQNMHDVAEDVRRQWGRWIAGVVPACTDMQGQRLYGVREWVVPALLQLLPQAEAKHLVELLFAERDRRRLRKLVGQLRNAASLLAQYQFCGLQSVLPDAPPHDDADPR